MPQLQARVRIVIAASVFAVGAFAGAPEARAEQVHMTMTGVVTSADAVFGGTGIEPGASYISEVIIDDGIPDFLPKDSEQGIYFQALLTGIVDFDNGAKIVSPIPSTVGVLNFPILDVFAIDFAQDNLAQTGNFGEVTIDAVNLYFEDSSSQTFMTDQLPTALDQVKLLSMPERTITLTDFGTGSTIVLSINTIVVTPHCPGELNGDGVVDAADLGVLLGAFGSNNPLADINLDGVVDAADLGVLLGAFGNSCP